jgi:hypothetical protein
MNCNSDYWGSCVDHVGICLLVAPSRAFLRPEMRTARIFAAENPPRAFLRLKMREGT